MKLIVAVTNWPENVEDQNGYHLLDFQGSDDELSEFKRVSMDGGCAGSIQYLFMLFDNWEPELGIYVIITDDPMSKPTSITFCESFTVLRNRYIA